MDGLLNGEDVGRHILDYRYEEHITASRLDENHNMSETMAFHRIETRPNGEQLNVLFAGSARLVNDTMYARGAYSRPYPDGAYPVPQGWIEVTDTTILDQYPGLESLVPRRVLRGSRALPGPLGMVFIPRQLQRVLPVYAVEVERTSLGKAGEIIRVTLAKEAALELGIYFEPDNSIDDALYAVTEGPPLVFTFTLDSAGNLTELAYTIDLALPETDMSGIDGLQQGFTLGGTVTQTMRIRIVSANEPVALAVVPPELGEITAEATP